MATCMLKKKKKRGRGRKRKQWWLAAELGGKDKAAGSLKRNCPRGSEGRELGERWGDREGPKKGSPNLLKTFQLLASSPDRAIMCKFILSHLQGPGAG